MPVFEYLCQKCGKRVSILIGMTAEPADEVCPSCGSPQLTKLVSKFRRGRTEDDRVEEIADRLETMGDPDSPSQMRDMVREMGKAMDDDMSDDMEELFESDMEDPDEPL